MISNKSLHTKLRKKRKKEAQRRVNAWLEEWNTASSERKREIEFEIFNNYTPPCDTKHSS